MIYLDNAATTFPKAPGVAGAVGDCLELGAGGPGRSVGPSAAAQARVVFDARRRVAELLGCSDPTDVVLTSGATFALNLALHGVLRRGDHVVTTALEHNAVARPLTHLESRGVEVTRVPCPDGLAPEPEAFRGALRSNTRLIAAIHGSNVSGALLPLEGIAAVAADAEVLLLVDASQTAGAVPLEASMPGLSMLAFTGHKGLLGPAGTGGLYVCADAPLEPLCRGGTGNRGFSAEQPTDRPDCFEPGTPNVPGFAGLEVGVRYVLDQGVESIRRHEAGLVERLLGELRALGGVHVYGPPEAEARAALVAFNARETDPARVGMLLEQDYGIITRCGFHCAAWAHESLGTLDRGAVRMSVSPWTTEEEIDAAVRAIHEIAGSA